MTGWPDSTENILGKTHATRTKATRLAPWWLRKETTTFNQRRQRRRRGAATKALGKDADETKKALKTLILNQAAHKARGGHHCETLREKLGLGWTQ